SHTVGAAITNRRVLGRNEAGIMATVGAGLFALTVIGILWPLVLAAPLLLLGGWIGISLIARALKLYAKEPAEHERIQRIVQRSDTRD
ncbi:MAG: hypothetical protein V4637_08590, partial [Pseudomonadota bacterium]